MKKTGYYLLLCLFFLAACHKKKKTEETTTSTTTVEEDKQTISNFMGSHVSCATQIRDGQFAQALFSFLDLQNGDVLSEEWVDSLANDIDVITGIDQITEDQSNALSTYAARYSWDRANREWIKSASDSLIFEFPATRLTASNNVKMILSSYSDGAFTESGTTVYLPTAGKAQIFKDGVELVKLQFSLSYSNSGYPLPTGGFVSVILKPYEYYVSVNQIDATHFEGTVELQKGSDCLTSLYGKVTLNKSDYTDLAWEKDVDAAEFNFTKGSFAIAGNWDVKAFYQLYDPNASYPDGDAKIAESLNASATVLVKDNGAKIGELRAKVHPVDGIVPYIYYKDGTDEYTEVYVHPFVDDLEAAFSSYFGTSAKVAHLRSKLKTATERAFRIQ